MTDQNRTGDLPFSSSVGKDIEHVDLASAALNVTIPLIKIPGRGLNSELILHWNSNAYIMAPRIDGLGRAFYIWSYESYSEWDSNSVLTCSPLSEQVQV